MGLANSMSTSRAFDGSWVLGTGLDPVEVSPTLEFLDADGSGVLLQGVYDWPDVFLNFSRKSSQLAVCGRTEFDAVGQVVKAPSQPLPFPKGCFGLVPPRPCARPSGPRDRSLHRSLSGWGAAVNGWSFSPASASSWKF